MKPVAEPENARSGARAQEHGSTTCMDQTARYMKEQYLHTAMVRIVCTLWQKERGQGRVYSTQYYALSVLGLFINEPYNTQASNTIKFPKDIDLRFKWSL